MFIDDDDKEGNQIVSLEDGEEMFVQAPPGGMMDIEDDFSDEDYMAKTKKKKARKNPKNTLDHTGRIENTKQDIRFDIDPLFVKTAEKFDERGTGSLLLHQLEVYFIC